jgi:hypothetical protein
MLDIEHYLPAKRKRTASGWISFNAPCCEHNNERVDKRQRGGMKSTPDGSWSFHCFNCGYTASFVMGRNLTFKARKLLGWLNVPGEEIEHINLESLKHKSINGILESRQTFEKLADIQFEEKDLPADMRELSVEAQAYLTNRHIDLDYPFLFKTMPRPGIVIPFTHENQVVGHCTRFLDNRTPKYLNDIQPGYVFGTDLQKPEWNHVLVMEGVFDALSIGGLAVLHAEVNDAQARLIRSLGKTITMVPDQDAAGMKLVDRAIELGWAVSMPEWDNDVKDVNDAVIKYGRLGALLTIMQARDTSKIKIELRKKQIVKRIRT